MDNTEILKDHTKEYTNARNFISAYAYIMKLIDFNKCENNLDLIKEEVDYLLKSYILRQYLLESDEKTCKDINLINLVNEIANHTTKKSSLKTVDQLTLAIRMLMDFLSQFSTTWYSKKDVPKNELIRIKDRYYGTNFVGEYITNSENTCAENFELFYNYFKEKFNTLNYVTNSEATRS